MHKLLSSHQSGNRKYYTPQKQTTLPLPTPSSKPWTLKIFSIFILLDLSKQSKALDSMDHYILLCKISHLGASPLLHIVYSWFVSYMCRLTEYNMCGQYCNFINAAINSWNTPLGRRRGEGGGGCDKCAPTPPPTTGPEIHFFVDQRFKAN